MLAFLVFFLLCIATVAWSFANPTRLLSMPFLMAGTGLFWIVPQLYVLSTYGQPEDMKNCSVFVYYMICCYLAAYSGFGLYTPRESRVRMDFHPIMFTRLAWATSILGGAGVLLLNFYFWRHGAPAGLWTGWPVYFYTLSKLVIPGVVFFRLLYLRYHNIKHQHLAILVSIPILIMVFIHGRRAWTFMLVFAWLVPAVLVGSFKLRRWHATVGVMGAFFVVSLLPAYRGEVIRDGWSGLVRVVQERSPGQVLDRYFSTKQTSEVREAMNVFSAIRHDPQPGLGRRFWNSIVHGYLPGSLVGRRAKERLKFRVDEYDECIERAKSWGYLSSTAKQSFYTAKTGFVDSFAEFWFLGVVLYMVMGRVFRQIYHQAFIERDARGIITLAFVGFFPASIIYGQWSFMLPTMLPTIVLCAMACRYGVIPLRAERRGAAILKSRAFSSHFQQRRAS